MNSLAAQESVCYGDENNKFGKFSSKIGKCYDIASERSNLT